MKRTLWCTDIHLNFLKPGGAEAFGSYMAAENPEADLMVITGDIAEAHNVKGLLSQLHEGWGRRIAFVLGNHDFYRGSFAGVDEELSDLPKGLIRLDTSEPILLDEHTALTGHQGWFDGRLGVGGGQSCVVMSDFQYIADLYEHYKGRLWEYPGERVDLLRKVRRLSDDFAEVARVNLTKALAQRDTVVFATHFPPFAEACWYQGALSDGHWMTWFTSEAMGSMLDDVAAQNPTKNILVLCGHTHSPGRYEHLPNLKVLTGKARYSAPDAAGVIETPLDWSAV